MEGKNYWRLRRFSLFYKYYAFVDTEEYLGDQLFIQQKVEVSFGKEFGKKGNDYLIIFCKVRKKDEKNFQRYDYCRSGYDRSKYRSNFNARRYALHWLPVCTGRDPGRSSDGSWTGCRSAGRSD